MIYHMLPRAEWEALPTGEAYAPASLRTEGFVHCSESVDQLLRVANGLYAREPGVWQILVIDEARLAAETRWEANPVERFPHVYGVIERAAIGAVVGFPRTIDGSFLPPAGV